MIRATRKSVLDAFRDQLLRDQIADPWKIAYRRGFRVVKLIVTAKAKAQHETTLTGAA